MYEEVVLQSVTKDIMMGEGHKAPRFRSRKQWPAILYN